MSKTNLKNVRHEKKFLSFQEIIYIELNYLKGISRKYHRSVWESYKTEKFLVRGKMSEANVTFTQLQNNSFEIHPETAVTPIVFSTQSLDMTDD